MSLADQFWARVEKGDPDACWRWLGSFDGKGAPRFTMKKTNCSARRIAWEVVHGERPPRHRHIEVTCGNRLCMNPSHMICPTTEERFWSKVERTEGCWNWTGGLVKAHVEGQKHFYGQFCYRPPPHGENVWSTAHRFSYELAHGPIPEADPPWFVCHHCDNPRCVRPDHLFLGTANDNMQDMLAKGRGRWQRERENMKRLASKAMGVTHGK